MAEIRAVSPKRDYWIKPGWSGWPKPNVLSSLYKDEAENARAKLRKQVSRGHMTVDQAQSLISHMAWKAVAKSTGMKYGFNRN